MIVSKDQTMSFSDILQCKINERRVRQSLEALAQAAYGIHKFDSAIRAAAAGRRSKR
jgi:hypothetical protein